MSVMIVCSGGDIDKHDRARLELTIDIEVGVNINSSLINQYTFHSPIDTSPPSSLFIKALPVLKINSSINKYTYNPWQEPEEEDVRLQRQLGRIEVGGATHTHIIENIENER